MENMIRAIYVLLGFTSIFVSFWGFYNAKKIDELKNEIKKMKGEDK